MAPTQRLSSILPSIWPGTWAPNKRGAWRSGHVPDPQHPGGSPCPALLSLGLFPGLTLCWAPRTGSVLPLKQFRFPIWLENKKRKEAYLCSPHNKTCLCFMLRPWRFFSARSQLWHTDTSSTTDANAFSLFRGENVSPLSSPRPRVPWGHPESGRGTWLTRRSTCAQPTRLGR